MPRGVYTRPKAGKSKPKAKTQALAKPKPSADAVAAPVSHAHAPELVARVEAAEPIPPNFYRNVRVNIDTIAYPDLKVYARSIGIMQRDVDGLTEARLRQNCKARVLDAIDD
jgi:hypothetical protein